MDHINDPKILVDMRRRAFADPNGNGLVTRQIPRKVGNIITTAKTYSSIANKFDKNFRTVHQQPYERTRLQSGVVNGRSIAKVEEEIMYKGFLFQRSHTLWAKYTSRGELGLFPVYHEDFVGKNSERHHGGIGLHGWKTDKRLNRDQRETTNCSNRLKLKAGAFLRGELRSDRLIDPEILARLPSQDPLDDNYNDTQTALDRSGHREGQGPIDSFSTQQNFFGHLSTFLELSSIDFGQDAPIMHSAWKPGDIHGYVHR